MFHHPNQNSVLILEGGAKTINVPNVPDIVDDEDLVTIFGPIRKDVVVYFCNDLLLSIGSVTDFDFQRKFKRFEYEVGNVDHFRYAKLK